jgi:GNAT superfamily N-acetyltransferase
MVRAGLIRQTRDRRDDRKRLLSLTPAGRGVHRRLVPVWEAIRAAAHDLLEEAGMDLLADMDRIEAALARRSVMDRVRRRLGMPAAGTVRIADYRPAYKKHFKALNEAWLRAHFTIEEHDAGVLNDPNAAIIRKGGAILFALLDDEVVGAAALVRHPGDLPELCKMAVAPHARRRGIGTALARAAIERAREWGAPRLYLQTSPVLEDALRVYRKLGFRLLKSHPLPRPEYQRDSITMALALRPGAPGRTRGGKSRGGLSR